MISISGNNTSNALSESTYYILLSLLSPQHGYGIMQDVKKMSNGRLTLAPGTLYGAIKALLDKGWIEFSKNGDMEKRKKVYTLTSEGYQVVQSEIVRLKELYQNGLIRMGAQLND